MNYSLTEWITGINGITGITEIAGITEITEITGITGITGVTGITGITATDNLKNGKLITDNFKSRYASASKNSSVLVLWPVTLSACQFFLHEYDCPMSVYSAKCPFGDVGGGRIGVMLGTRWGRNFN